MRTERRRYPRAKVSHRVLYSSDTYSRPRIVSAIDLSLGGTRIETTPYGLIPGEELEMYIVVHPKVIKCRGKVVHTLRLKGERLQAGIAFEEISEQDKLYLGEHISDLVEQQNKRFNASA
jgi:hypothetical protein